MPLGIKEFRKYSNCIHLPILLPRKFVMLDLVNPCDLVNFFLLPKKFTKSSFTCTMISTVVLTRPFLCSKSAIFIEAWHIVNLKPCSYPLEALLPHIRAFK